MPPEPTKEEEAAARAKEAAEQGALPYNWTQTIGDLDVTVEVPGNLKGRDLNVDIKKKKLVLGIKGQEAIINVWYIARHSLGCFGRMLYEGKGLIKYYRATFHTKFMLMNQPGHSQPRQREPRSLNFTSTR